MKERNYLINDSRQVMCYVYPVKHHYSVPPNMWASVWVILYEVADTVEDIFAV